ncbi:beta-ketoacyl-[acyl-carrier-protein] synthase II [bacterium]|nr:beta-ketoacyl-[acyl-carrier-protein] synthase II [bacterium]
MKITAYEALCNLGNNIETIYHKAINGDISCFDNLEGYINEGIVRAGLIKTDLPIIYEKDYNLRCNKLLLKNCELLKDNIQDIGKKYSKDKIGVIIATTNSGVEEFEKSENSKHFELGNPALFLKSYFGLSGFYATVSTACSSGLKAFSSARDLLNNNICDAVIIGCVDSLAKVPIYGFNSLEVLSDKPSVPFSKNRCGMNIGEGCAIFIAENDSSNGIKILGIGESSDIYHLTTPDPQAKEAINAMNSALNEAGLKSEDIDYINAHATGTIANDIMESNAIYKVFNDKTPVSSTKPLTGHCLGAAAGIETALCCKLLDSFDGRLYPHIFDKNYDKSLPKMNLVELGKKYQKCNVCMCNSFGFGGTNAIMIMGKNYE